ncbi:DUF1651 domain-containing protein [Synechococcus sp. Tobar12-5m-g]|uniref:DUF1651 domain-containing protein n=1 Tax=unclassified Synechococcus TaxID=2626047 RepID=UPI0020CC601F|nr:MULTISPECIES: DUF1651 domain-containing protein [unclassified Synechococcus]MCP9772736.1 DUF1651 domain-containing protein [Synechococcus sp. Tobar12-5m-g]MCP9873627.1 DUF1651 domain-containing protein [Synechococcus sp. Cruz CV-v-12]
MSGDSENWSSTHSRWRLTEPKAEVITSELLPDQEIPLLKRRQDLRRTEALKPWAEKRRTGWAPCSPKW